MSIDKRPLKAFVRFDGTGRIVPSSLILRRKKPKVGNWVEIPAYECCNPAPPDVLTRTLCAQITYSDGFIESILFVFSETIDGRDVYTRIFNYSEIDYSGYVCRYDSELETYVIYYVYGYSEGNFEYLYFTGENQFPNSPLDVTGWVTNGEYVDPETIFNIFECAEPEFARFDVTADWSLTTPVVVDETSFRTFLESGSDGDGNLNRFINLRIRNFSLSGGRLQCDLKAYTEYVGLSSINVTQFNSVGGYNNIFSSISLSYNQITSFDPNTALPSSLLGLSLNNNQIVTFDPSIALPSSLQQLNFNSNQIVTFNPTLPLPNSLKELYLDDNQIVTFDPTLPLPSSLIYLGLGSNQIVTFNPTLPLPNSLFELDLNSNQIVTFDSTLPLPSSLIVLRLSDNQIVTFNPSIPLPSSLFGLLISGNQIVTFDPSIPLPNSLVNLILENNQIVTFNPTLPLPNSLVNLYLQDNQMTTAGYTGSEPWANAMTVIPSRGNVYFNANINSVSGTNLETILTAKGWTVTA
jgi:Leucine-rich repeat (LRR) protein